MTIKDHDSDTNTVLTYKTRVGIVSIAMDKVWSWLFYRRSGHNSAKKFRPWYWNIWR